MNIRPISERDHAPIVAVVNEWWGGRQIAGLLPRLFFAHFQDTSFAIEDAGRVIAFLIGFVSQTNPRQAYIHFVGVHPEYRKHGLGKQLYELFFETARARSCDSVHCITAPINSGSIAFHRRMGFQIEKSEQQHDGVAFTADYDGPGQDRVLFVRRIA
jgi:ribosomal protein S18 acetylase RimI-like enzyme